jgi:hypothetical protein
LDFIPSNRCPHVTELLPFDLLSGNPLQRIKYYQRPCREHPLLRCFYDETRMCLCTHRNHTDYFRFDLNIKFECDGYNYCENGGQCYQSHPYCPTTSQGSCVKCYFGTRCQLTIVGYSLSLDTILGYRIVTLPSLRRQSSVVKLSLAITLLLFAVGFIGNVWSIITFARKNSSIQVVGCGHYLLASSVVSVLSLANFIYMDIPLSKPSSFCSFSSYFY